MKPLAMAILTLSTSAAAMTQPRILLKLDQVSDEIEPGAFTPEDQIWPRAGALEMVFSFPNIGSTLDLASELREGYAGATLAELPFLKARFWCHLRDGLHTGAGINFTLPDVEGNEKNLQLALSRLDGQKRYHLLINWNLPENELEVYLQGVRQGDLGHWGSGGVDMADVKPGPGRIGDPLRGGGKEWSSMAVESAVLWEAPLTAAFVAARALEMKVPPLRGEGRRVFERGLALDMIETVPVFQTTFQKEISWEHEEGLLKDGKRVKEPEADWVLEGPHAGLEKVDDGLYLWTDEPDDRKLGHIVLWLNKQIPPDFLLEYTFTPENDRKGLGIVFFNTRNPDGDSIFDVALPARRGMFREYIMGEIDSYHVSPWAADDVNLRRTSNLRKNSGFMLVSVGDDRIGGAGPGPHRVRILKKGGHIQVEANGVMVLEHRDDGKAQGPVHTHAGLIGLRFMAHSGSVTLHALNVFALQPKPGDQP